jgi:uncharacterized protein YyaL (SSP411 family)
MENEQTNALAESASAYLRSAMHQPVRWHEWGEEAFAAAQREHKPILLDIGAVWCHWCHVMDRESYENPEVARIINEHFIAVKVDRDERPDVDSRYQAAVQAMSGQGGWPLTAFLTPDGKPFFGGTYFPATEQWGRPSFPRVLLSIADAFHSKQGDVLHQASLVMGAIGQAESFAAAAPVPPDIVHRLVQSAVNLFDPAHGGFGTAPKFPHPSALDLIIHRYARTGDAALGEVVVSTLEHMARGGVYDQLGGGFHRYSVDERWVVPHFEKMSYDNSELLKNYVHGYQATGNALFAQMARDIIRWMDEWLSDRAHGGFYASQDADISLDDDGDYFTWTLEEVRGILGGDELKVAQLHYDINEVGEMHHNPAKNVLCVRAGLPEIAARLGLREEQVAALLDAAKRKLYAARLERPTPFVDKTIYTGWNGLCVSAYLEAARVLGLDGARKFALRTLDRLLSEGWDASRGLKHVIAYGGAAVAPARAAEVAGLLDDYAFVTLACLDAFEATVDATYFSFARALAEFMIERFHDKDNGGFFDSEAGALGALQARRKPFQDSPTPSGNGAAAIALLRLHAHTDEARYREIAQRTLEAIAGVAEQFGMFAATCGMAAVWLLEGHTQAVVVGGDEQARALYAAAAAPFALNKAVLWLRDSAEARTLPPALLETISRLPALKEGRNVAVLCSNFTCRPPITDPVELARALHEDMFGLKEKEIRTKK